MSCLDVMYQVYGPPQPYFAAAYSPYHHQKLAFYSKMQDAPERSSGASSFSSHSAPAVKEEDCGREKECPPEAEYINSRCVLFTYFQGDISAVVDEHFSRALSQPGSYAPSTAAIKSARNTTSWREPYSTASLHSHLHHAPTEPWHHTHHHHHPYTLSGAISSQSSAYPRPSMHDVYGTHFDPRYSSLLVPSVRPHRLTPTTVPTPGTPQCDIGKSEAATSAWTTPGAFSGPGADMGQSLSLNVDAGKLRKSASHAITHQFHNSKIIH
ncbi:UNVERIFIED_CONTAM: hypothetical protein FKN15_015475 [Acipenser sinensis]